MRIKQKYIMDTIITPWKVETNNKIDYDKLIHQFGTQKIDENVIAQFERVTKKIAHPWIKRGIFFSHRDLGDFLTAYEKGEDVFLYTGRGPSTESLHLGHMIPFMFTKYLQDIFNCPVIIQISDDEKYYFKNMPFEEIYRLGFENAKDIIAFGFNPKKTYIFSNRDYRLKTPEYEIMASSVFNFVTQKTLQKIFGFDESATVGMYTWPIYQSIAAFSQVYPKIFKNKNAKCLIAYAIDQDPYFRLSRDIADKLKLLKPSSIMSIFLEPLTGNGKMSSSDKNESTLFLTDSSTILRKKIMKYAFSGGGGNGSLEDHKKYGGNVNVDIACKYLLYFEMNDNKLKEIYDKFSKGELTCGDTKKILADTLIPYIMKHQEERAKVTQNDIFDFYNFYK
jgi:tryptophanyl-tRNA synthetase